MEFIGLCVCLEGSFDMVLPFYVPNVSTDVKCAEICRSLCWSAVTFKSASQAMPSKEGQKTRCARHLRVGENPLWYGQWNESFRFGKIQWDSSK